MAGDNATGTGRRAIASVVEQLQEEQRWFTLMRLSFAGVCLSWLLLIGWAVPGTPITTTISDSDSAIVLGLIFGLAALCTTVAFWFIWLPSFKNETARQFLRVLLGGQQLIRSRQQFTDRLAAECRRAGRKDAAGLSVIVVSLPDAQHDPRARSRPPASQPSLGAMLVRSTARGDDVVADVRPDEVWVLAIDVDEATRAHVVRRLAQAIVTSDVPLGERATCHVGGSALGEDGTSPESLMMTARSRLAPVLDISETRVAA